MNKYELTKYGVIGVNWRELPQEELDALNAEWRSRYLGKNSECNND